MKGKKQCNKNTNIIPNYTYFSSLSLNDGVLLHHSLQFQKRSTSLEISLNRRKRSRTKQTGNRIVIRKNKPGVCTNRTDRKLLCNNNRSNR
jgi:hypothetical protein